MDKLQGHIKLAYDYGIIKSGYTLEDYIIEAVEKNGYETIGVWGVQGSGKSTRMLQMGYWVFRRIYEDEVEAWNAVLDHIVFKPSDFIKRMEKVPHGERIPVILWDDLGCHYTSSTFKTDIQQYQAIDATWAVIRTKLAVVITTIPLLDRMAKNIKDNITFEVFIGRNQRELMKRVFHLPGLKRMDTNLFKVQIEDAESFDLYEVPEWVWEKYWKMRLELTDEALAGLRGVTDMEDLENYTPVWEIAKDLTISANTIQQMGSRKLIPTHIIGGNLCIPNDFIPELKEQYSRV